MIDYIKGEITNLTPTYCVLETCGVGYMLNISLVTFSELQNLSSARLFVYENIREDAHTLYGFFEEEERNIFLLLISVSGIGANTARMIQSSFSPAELKEAISTGNVNAIKSVKGIGLKSAQRIIVDLKDKVNKSNEGGDLPLIEVAANNEKIHEAVAALVMLGFQQQASQKTVDKIVKEEPQLEVAKIIKKALSMI
ncbi:MAG: Holliday junction branch migration protein RuvA [Paludibacteraceae bacterium]|nr:Holliday junction branch migration protein RuvA [Paludibacteraceae bacterium]